MVWSEAGIAQHHVSGIKVAALDQRPSEFNCVHSPPPLQCVRVSIAQFPPFAFACFPCSSLFLAAKMKKRRERLDVALGVFCRFVLFVMARPSRAHPQPLLLSPFPDAEREGHGTIQLYIRRPENGSAAGRRRPLYLRLCKERATTIARYIDDQGRALRQRELCERHAAWVKDNMVGVRDVRAHAAEERRGDHAVGRLQIARVLRG